VETRPAAFAVSEIRNAAAHDQRLLPAAKLRLISHLNSLAVTFARCNGSRESPLRDDKQPLVLLEERRCDKLARLSFIESPERRLLERRFARAKRVAAS